MQKSRQNPAVVEREREYQRLWYQKNREKHNERMKEYSRKRRQAKNQDNLRAEIITYTGNTAFSEKSERMRLR
jgi:hypothetical protein